MTPKHTPLRSPSVARSVPARVLGSSDAVVVIGRVADVPRALEHPAMSERFRVVGAVTVSEDDDQVRAHAESLHYLLTEHQAGVVMVAGPIGPETMRAVGDLALLHGCRLLAVMPSELVAGSQPRVVWEGDAPLVQLFQHRQSRAQGVAKRAVDILGASVGLVLLSPLMLIMAAAIRLESRGSAMFRHRRVGRNGAPFDCFKFRTMREDAEEILFRDAKLKRLYRENNYKLPEELDPRVTFVGKFLRKSSLDELPQLFNVLRGEMSLVGPRPVVEDELEHYRGSERLLLSVRPGMTGEWAVSGRHHVGYPARSEIELRYVRNWGLRRDAGILLGTVRAVLDPGSDANV